MAQHVGSIEAKLLIQIADGEPVEVGMLDIALTGVATSSGVELGGIQNGLGAALIEAGQSLQGES
ncbi:hypothetical protein E3T43_07305 [Cryobacterium sp. Hh7]|uniref:hypothetical protein n=1 Tax=Cryobacterium sp. Hh7 TaxID=1259159 RepID=UPI00106B520F|nr:hypothetical protein [Cryobacterium sp. Hh7]TFD58046.1 hypothetical protein E3T43_07305 [Cryobacterium sp. Hh7]